jgi:predicted ArsR family transcriptional regulator
MANTFNSTPSVTTRILTYLKTGADITQAQARKRFGITNVRARMSELRQAGYAIYLNEKTTANGRTIKAYRLGTPTRLMVAAGNAVMSDPNLAPIVEYAQSKVSKFSGNGLPSGSTA